ncbi:hypothetical protein HG531_003630 [Fusarium graminearum]|nr:hypothetical protein HG531_003630 [Fusarium graminearum]
MTDKILSTRVGSVVEDKLRHVEFPLADGIRQYRHPAQILGARVCAAFEKKLHHIHTILAGRYRKERISRHIASIRVALFNSLCKHRSSRGVRRVRLCAVLKKKFDTLQVLAVADINKVKLPGPASRVGVPSSLGDEHLGNANASHGCGQKDWWNLHIPRVDVCAGTDEEPNSVFLVG